MSVDLGTIHITPNQQAVTAQPTGSGWLGNVWDIVKTTATEMIKTGGNILLQKAQDKFAPPVASTAGYPAFAQKSQSPEIIYNPSEEPKSKFATDLYLSTSPIQQFLQPIIQPAVAEGIKEGMISVAQKPPVWVWAVLGVLGVVIVMQGVRR